jgi:SWIM/SEC-C metal-binding protein
VDQAQYSALPMGYRISIVGHSSIGWIYLTNVGRRAKIGFFGRNQSIHGCRLSFYRSLDHVMSDKFFFKGRQDVRENHVESGYKTKGSPKAGSKKYPLSLVVTNEARKQEVEALVAEAQLHALVKLDSSEDAAESINELTVLLNKNAAVKLDKIPARNEPCPCGSGKKYKKCCA